MKYPPGLLIAVAMCGGCVSAPPTTYFDPFAPVESRVVTKTIDGAGWRLNPTGEWQAEPTDDRTYLRTTAHYRDFVLHLEFFPEGNVNSGVFVRCQEGQETLSPEGCYEINIWDAHPNQDWRTGAIPLHATPPLAQVETVGQWNNLHLTVSGNSLLVQINGVITADYEDDSSSPLTEGFLALQSDNGETVRFRNIRLERL